MPRSVSGGPSILNLWIVFPLQPCRNHTFGTLAKVASSEELDASERQRRTLNSNVNLWYASLLRAVRSNVLDSTTFWHVPFSFSQRLRV